jgi:hypothetical protein
MWQIGLQYKQQRVDWGYVMPTYDQETIDMERDNLSYYERIVVRIVWMSPAWLDQQPEFEGW